MNNGDFNSQQVQASKHRLHNRGPFNINVMWNSLKLFEELVNLFYKQSVPTDSLHDGLGFLPDGRVVAVYLMVIHYMDLALSFVCMLKC